MTAIGDYNGKNKVVFEFISFLMSFLKTKSIYTYFHSLKTQRFAFLLGVALDFSEKELIKLSIGALLHDVGKIGIENSILNKKGALTEEEWKVIKKHPQMGVEIVAPILEFYPCELAILHHHERWDGTGYPTGLKGNGIPLEARILAIVDAFSAMTSPRPYQLTKSYDEAIFELKKEKGKQFDPELVEIFVKKIVKKIK